MDPNDSQNPTEDEDGNSPKWLTELRRKAEAYDKEVPALQRDLALTKAGIDESNPLTELFVNGYKGEWTPDAVKEAADKYGLVKTTASTTTEQTDQQQTQQVQTQQVAGAEAAENDPVEQLRKIAAASAAADLPSLANEDWKNAKSPEEALRLYQQAGGLVSYDAD